MSNSERKAKLVEFIAASEGMDTADVFTLAKKILGMTEWTTCEALAAAMSEGLIHAVGKVGDMQWFKGGTSI